MSERAASRFEGEARGRVFWVALVVGWAVMVGGIIGAIADHRRSDPLSLVRWAVGLAVLHDAILAPITIVIAWAITRLLPPVARGPVRGGLALTALLVVFSIPLVRRLGAHPSNSSALPLDYAHSLVVVLVLVWAATLAVIGSRIVRARQTPSG